MPKFESGETIKILKKACNDYKKIFDIEKIDKEPTVWEITGGNFRIADDRNMAMSQLRSKHAYRFKPGDDYEHDPDLLAELEESRRYTGPARLDHLRKEDYKHGAVYTKEEREKTIEKFEKKIAAIDSIQQSLEDNNLEEAAKKYINTRDILEEDLYDKGLPPLSTLCLLAPFLILSIPALPIVALGNALWNVVFPSDKHPFEPFSDFIKKSIKEKVPIALENECLVYKKQLEKKRSTYENKLEANSLSPKIQTKLEEKINRASQKITSLDKLLNIFQDKKLADMEKLKRFTDEFEKIKTDPKHALAEKKNARLKLFLHTTGHILATVATLGLYAGVRAAYAHDERGTLKFWHTKKDTFKENVGQNLKKPHPSK